MSTELLTRFLPVLTLLGCGTLDAYGTGDVALVDTAILASEPGTGTSPNVGGPTGGGTTTPGTNTGTNTGTTTAGTTGTDPTVYFADFESGMPSDFVMSGNANWRTGYNGAYTGSMGARSGSITHNETSQMSLTVTMPADGHVSFWTTGDSEQGSICYDYLSFSVDQGAETQWCGVWTNENHVEFLSAGAHTLTWEYYKDGSIDSTGDQAWVDLLEVRVGYP